MKRYQKQISLSEVGEAGQKRLAQARILIVGAGGLGTPAALYLAAAGVKTIVLLDADRVDVSNLNRQVLYREEDQGQYKVEVLQGRLQKQNPEVTIEAVREFINLQNAERLFADIDLVIDGTDNFAAKFLLNDLCLLYQKPLVYGAISGFEGQLSVFNVADSQKQMGPCYRCYLPRVPQSLIRNCAEAGVLGPMAGLIGLAQAMEALKYFLNLPLLAGQMQIHDLLENQVRKFKIVPRQDCICRSRETLTKDGVAKLYAQVPVAKCEPHWLKGFQLLQKNHEVAVIDVREPHEVDSNFLREQIQSQNWICWPLSLLQKGELPPDLNRPSYYVVCASGLRAGKAIELLKQTRYKNLDLLSV